MLAGSGDFTLVGTKSFLKLGSWNGISNFDVNDISYLLQDSPMRGNQQTSLTKKRFRRKNKINKPEPWPHQNPVVQSNLKFAKPDTLELNKLESYQPT